jgi:hypothetical protein
MFDGDGEGGAVIFTLVLPLGLRMMPVMRKIRISTQRMMVRMSAKGV